MSILDGLIGSQKELAERVFVSAEVSHKTLEALKLNDGAKQVFELMSKGLSLADIFEFTPESRNAVFGLGCKLFQTGELEKARAVLTQLAMFEPMDPRPLYVLGAISQAEQDFRTAAQYYVNFLGLDATNASGYLRLAECLFGAREYKEASDCVETALNFLKDGKGAPDDRAHAQKLRKLISEFSAPPEAKS